MSAASKVLSEKPTDLELQVAQAFVDLEAQSELKAELRALQFKSVREIDVGGGKKALAIFFPHPSMYAYTTHQSIAYRHVSTHLITPRTDPRLDFLVCAG